MTVEKLIYTFYLTNPVKYVLLLVKAFIITESAANAAGSVVGEIIKLHYGFYNRLFTDFQLFYPDFFYLVKIKA